MGLGGFCWVLGWVWGLYRVVVCSGVWVGLGCCVVCVWVEVVGFGVLRWFGVLVVPGWVLCCGLVLFGCF